MTPDLWAIIPVKPFGAGKSRLASVLDASERAALSQRLFRHVFDTAAAALGVRRIVVVTPDTALAASVNGRGGRGVIHDGDLNAALGHACRTALTGGAQAVMVLPSDLPFVSQQDIAALLAALAPAPGAVIAPDAADEATNALVLAPPDPDFFRFGPRSFAAHREMARARCAALAVVRQPGLAFDLDTPAHYRAFLARTAERARV
jgi:2-phospho-L-lactate/phosphoenolpyruvate guanylyltransferase